MKSLIVNADDFGLTPGVNEGILRAFREGILTSATLMANADAFENATELARRSPEFDIGVHLVLIGGQSIAPPAEIPTLVNRAGELPASLFDLVARVSTHLIRTDDIAREFHAQIDKVIAAGITPSHLDTHKHTHAHPAVMDALFRVASERKIPRVRRPFEEMALSAQVPETARAYTQRFLASVAGMTASTFRRGLRAYNLLAPDYFFGVTLTGNLGTNALKNLIARLPEGTSEIMTHPGICDAALEQNPTRLKQQRQLELEALLAPEVLQAIRDHGIRLIPYRDLN
jgi:hopanoid biosynthesis associated protein HpnK